MTWNTNRAQTQYKEPGGELGGWRIPLEVKTAERQKRKFWERESGYLSVLKSRSKWQNSKKWQSLYTLWVWVMQTYDTSQRSHWKVPVLLQLLLKVSFSSHSPPINFLRVSFLLLKIIFKIIESLSSLFKLGSANNSASLHSNQRPSSTLVQEDFCSSAT